MYKKIIKPFFDFFAAFIGLLILSPLFLLLGIALSFSNNGNPFFVQARPGKDEKIFRLVKFKTMNDKRDIYGSLLPDAYRLTNIGKFVRKTSMDEIPQLLNVLNGDMSLVGPRPLLVKYLPLYNETQKLRHNVKPGITGWAQVNGRNTISWEQKFEYDVWYVNNVSFAFDIKILVRTISKVFRSEGISQMGEVTMKPFKGKAFI